MTSPTYVLVHGAWLSSWCWREVGNLLAARRLRAVAPDLLAHGAERSARASATMPAYVAQIAEVVRVESRSAPVVLVGHSMAGAIISGVAEQIPDDVHRLVYVAGYLLGNGQSIMDASSLADDGAAAPNFEFSADYSEVSIRRTALADVFAHDADAETRAELLERARAEPTLPFQHALTLTPGRYDVVPRRYVRTALDRVITPKAQAAMLAATPTPVVATLETSHTPFFAQPALLVEALLAAAA